MSKVISVIGVEQKIFYIRGQKVMLSSHLAELYGVEVRVLIQAVKRNEERFPQDFMFQLTREEAQSLRSQFVILNADASQRGKHVKFLPYAFSEQGIAMLSSVLRSKRAIAVNIAIIRAFVKLREVLATHKELAVQFKDLERKVGTHDHQIAAIFEAIRKLMAPPPEKPKRPISIFTETQKTFNPYGKGLLPIRNKMLTPTKLRLFRGGFIVDRQEE